MISADIRMTAKVIDTVRSRILNFVVILVDRNRMLFKCVCGFLLFF